MSPEPAPIAPATPLQTALIKACEFAIEHGVEEPLTPADFGIQRSDAGSTNATYVDASHAVTVFIDNRGNTRFAVAELYWIHNESDEDREPCDYCEVIDVGDFADPDDFGPPMHDVFLPGDAPAAPRAQCPHGYYLTDSCPGCDADAERDAAVTTSV